MTRKEIVLTALEHKQPPRPPFSFSAMPELYERLKRDLKLSDEEMWKKFGGDIIFVGPIPKFQASPIAYADPTIEITPEGYYRDIWGVDFRVIEHTTGKYVDLIRHPLAYISSSQDLENYAYWPKAEIWDYSTIKSQCLAYSQYATIGHSRGFFEISWFFPCFR
ncbi:hypothetical protein H5T87_07825, partial [bacterium]|nr:hypothetical protein [bacterium]